MSRTRLSPQRLSGIRKTNIGRIIIFCEGETEKSYFDYFAEIINKNKYTDVEVVLKTASGNARTVLNSADKFLEEEQNGRKYNHYGKYLAFDCDDPPDVQKVIHDAGNYELLISNYLFEVWLLMHFEDVTEKLTKREILQRLSVYLRDGYAKGQQGKIREIIQNGDVEKAIDNGKMLERRYVEADKSILTDIKDMNPYTSVYKLIGQFMTEIS